MFFGQRLNRIALMLISTGISLSASAAWVEIGSNESGTFYIDPPSIQRSGSIVKMWYLVDFRNVQVDSNTKQFLSSKDLSEYDCQQERARTVYYNNYSEKMGGGKITFTLKDPLQWRPATSGTVASALLKIACTTK